MAGNLQNLASSITRHVNVFKADVAGITNPCSTDSIITTVQLNEMQASITDARTRLQDATQFLAPAAGTNEAEIEQIKTEVTNADKTAQILSKVVEVQQRFASLETSKLTLHEVCRTIADAQNIVKELNQDDEGCGEIISNLKTLYLHRRAKIQMRVKQLLRQSLHVLENGVAVKSTVKLADFDKFTSSTEKMDLGELFDCCKIFDVLDSEMQIFCRNLIDLFLMPVVLAPKKEKTKFEEQKPDATYKLRLPSDDDERILEATEEVMEKEFIKKWICEPRGENALPRILTETAEERENRKPNLDFLRPSIKKKKPGISTILPVLLSLFKFLNSNLGPQGTNPEGANVLKSIGKQLWPDISREIIQRFETDSPEESLAAADLEAGAEQFGLISDETDFRRKLDEVDDEFPRYKKIELLADARTRILSADMSSVRIWHDPENSIVDFDGPLVEKLDDDPAELFHGFMVIPEMSITSTTQWLVEQIRDVVRRSAEAAEAALKDEDKSKTACYRLFQLARQLVGLFTVLRPHAHRHKLLNDPVACALFYNDCMYIGHSVTVLTCKFEEDLKPVLAWQNSLADFVVELRKLATVFFTEMLKLQQTKIEALMPKEDEFHDLGTDEKFDAMEEKVTKLLLEQEQLSLGWITSLPEHIWLPVVARLTHIIMEPFLTRLFSLPQMTVDDRYCWAHFLESVRDTAIKLLSIDDDITKGSEQVTCWKEFCIVVDLLDADFGKFMARRVELKGIMSGERIRKLLALSGVEDVPQAFEKFSQEFHPQHSSA